MTNKEPTVPSQGQIARYQERLQIYRSNLAHYLGQAGRFGGEANVPLEVMHGIAEARGEIRRLKTTLRKWGVAVTDLPDEEVPEPIVLAAEHSSTRAVTPTWLAWFQQHSAIVVAGVLIIVACVVAALVPKDGAFCQQTRLPVICSQTNIINIAVRTANAEGRSLPGISVTLLHDGQATTAQPTDAIGVTNFSIRSDSGKGQVVAQADQYEVRIDSIELTENRNISMTLRRRDDNLRSVIVRAADATDRRRVVGAKVTLISNDAIYIQQTDDNGLAVFSLPFTGDALQADVTVQSTGKEISNQRMTLQPNRIQDVTLK